MEAQGGYNTEDAHHQINMEKGKECQALPVKKPGLLDDEGCVREDLPNGFHREPEWDKARALEDAPIFMGTTCFPPRPDVRNIMITGGAGFMYEGPLKTCGRPAADQLPRTDIKRLLGNETLDLDL